ncbi:MAG: hypothetical protein AUJ07_08675 [Crenarchaeota archaeon 13_1_40CM_3_53_5]|nr:MAG: hypothetical protein AUJ07_08675 [Crenarchaeota archaeon 13_1_40CM_3_53_5]
MTEIDLRDAVTNEIQGHNVTEELIVDLTAGAHRTELEIGYSADLCFDIIPRDSRTRRVDWRQLPLEPETVDLLIFDPPHQVYGFGRESWLVDTFSSFRNIREAEAILTESFAEFRRVLKPNGSLLLKWSTNHRPLSWILGLSGMQSRVLVERSSLSAQPSRPFSHRAIVSWTEMWK